MECWSCQAVNPRGSKFCYRCGKSMPADRDMTPAATEQWRPAEGDAWPPPAQQQPPQQDPAWVGAEPVRPPQAQPGRAAASAPTAEQVQWTPESPPAPARPARRRGVPGVVWFLLGIVLVVALGAVGWFLDWLRFGPEAAPVVETRFVEVTPQAPLQVTVVVTPAPPAVEPPAAEPPAAEPPAEVPEVPVEEPAAVEQPVEPVEAPVVAEEPVPQEFFDGRIAVSVAGVEITRDLPAEYGLPSASAGTTYASVMLIVTRIEGVHLTSLLGFGDAEPALHDGDGQAYDMVYGTFRGIQYSDPTDIRSPYEVVEGAEAIYVYQIPEDRQPATLHLVYSYRETWDEGSPEMPGEMPIEF